MGEIGLPSLVDLPFHALFFVKCGFCVFMLQDEALAVLLWTFFQTACHDLTK